MFQTLELFLMDTPSYKELNFQGLELFKHLVYIGVIARAEESFCGVESEYEMGTRKEGCLFDKGGRTG